MRYIFLIFHLFCAGFAVAQPDTIFQIPAVELTPSERITETRQLLRGAFLGGDDAATNAWLDTLILSLEDRFLAATYAEERWLLWYWTGNYERLFDDVRHYDQHYRYVQSQKVDPPADGLMTMLDEVSVANQHQLYQKISEARLSPEDAAFATMQLEYLLTPRPTAAESAAQDDQAVAFLEKFRLSRFRYYVREFLYSGNKTIDRGNDFDLLFVVARPDGRFGNNFRTSFGGSVGVGWWWKRYQLGGRLGLGFQGTDRDFMIGPTEVAEDSTAMNFTLGLEAGYTVLDNGKIRVMPLLGFGGLLLSVPARRPIELAHRISYFNACATFGVTLDYRWGSAKRNEEWAAGGTAQGAVRFSLGYQWLGLGNNNQALRGNLFYVGVGVGLRTRQAYRLPSS